MKKIIISTITISILFFTSCIKEIDGPIVIPSSSFPKIEIPLVDDNSGSYYKKAYYNLETKTIVKSSYSKDWFIAFNSNPTNNFQKVILNYGLSKVCNGFTLKDTNFFEIKKEDIFLDNTRYYANFYDNFATLFQDNFDNLSSKKYVYYAIFDEKGMFKIQILDYSTTSITFRYASLNNSVYKEVTLPLAPNQNYTYFSFETNAPADIEPADKSTWDIEFSRYTTFITDFGSPQMYAVNGALFNPSKSIQSTYIQNEKIENINLQKTTNLIYSDSLDGIGYSWKIYSNAGADGFYTIAPRVYIVKNTGKTYVLQFIEYSKLINNVNVRGYPTFLQNSL